MSVTYSANYYERELQPKAGLLTCPRSLSTSSCTLQMIAQQETVIHCLLFTLQAIYLHKLSPHTSSQPITSCIYKQLLSPLTNQIAHQGT